MFAHICSRCFLRCLRRSLENQGSVCLLEGVFCGMCLFMDVSMVSLRLSQLEVNGLEWGSVEK